jgi:predicted ATPase
LVGDDQMNFGEFKDRAKKVGEVLENNLNMIKQTPGMTSELISKLPSLMRLDCLVEMMPKLLAFLNDTESFRVLSNYHNKKNEDIPETPLDNLCEFIITKLKSVEQYIDNLSLAISNNSYLMPHTYQILGKRLQLDHLNGILLDNLYFSLNEIYKSNLLIGFNVFRRLEGHRKTLIVIGPNGSGKTSLANFLSTFESHVRVIPANKPIFVRGAVNSILDSTFEKYNSELYSKRMSYSGDLLTKLIVSLCRQHDDIAREYFKGIRQDKKTTFSEVNEIFKKFFHIELDDSKFFDKKMQAKNSCGDFFDFNSMSDGERVGFFYIATVLVAPEKSFIVVDEPETHLNPGVYNELWDKLIDRRSDCQFIFISHTMEFLTARSDYELLRIKSFTYPDKFEFDFLGNTFANLDKRFIIDIFGSRKPILFCEGEETASSLDRRVYEALVGEMFTVISAGNCISVKENVIACNNHALNYGAQFAKGIIDFDFRSDSQISNLKEKDVFVLPCNEIEMLLIDESIFLAVQKHNFNDPDEYLKEFKEKFFNKLKERKNYIISRNSKIQIEEKLGRSINIKQKTLSKEIFKEKFNMFISDIDPESLWNTIESKISEIIDTKNYEEALKYCCLEHNEILGQFTDDNYVRIAINLLKTDVELKNKIKVKYLSELLADYNKYK